MTGTALTVLGVAVAAFLLLGAYVRHSYTFDSAHRAAIGVALYMVGCLVADGARVVGGPYTAALVLLGTTVGILGYAMDISGLHHSWREIVLDSWLVGVCLLGVGYNLVLLAVPLDDSSLAMADGLSLAAAVWALGLGAILSGPFDFPNSWLRGLYLGIALNRVLTWLAFAANSGLQLPWAHTIGVVGVILGYAATIVMGYLLRATNARTVPMPRQPRPPMFPYLVFGATTTITLVCFFGNPQGLHSAVLLLTVLSTVAVVLRQLATLQTFELLTARITAREEYFRTLVQDSSDVIMICTRDGLIDYVSPASTKVLGPGIEPGDALAEALGIDPDLAAEGYRHATDEAPVSLTGTRGELTVEALVSRRDDGLLLVSVRDVSEHERMRSQLHELAYNDPLTGLDNRRRVLDRISAQLASGDECVVLFIDLDRFKQVNDVNGHAVGDGVLQQVASRLRRVVGSANGLGRIGGDEFVIVSEGVAHGEALARTVGEALKVPFIHESRSYQLGASVGVAVAGADRPSPNDLLRQADLAMGAAKRAHSGWSLYRPELGESAVAQAERDAQVARALRERDLLVHFQPIIDVATQQVRAVEALLRWRDEQGRVQSPYELLDFARRSGQIVDVSRWVLDEAVRQVVANGSAVAVAVNLPPGALLAPRMSEDFDELLSAHGFDARRLEVEITKDELFDEARPAARAISRLRELGARVMIDDFGTGFSSLSYLVDLPIDGLKIDRRFISALPQSQTCRSVVGGVVAVARQLDLRLVAEGIETAAQHSWTARLGVEMAQGYHYARPRPLDPSADLTTLTAWHTLPTPS